MSCKFLHFKVVVTSVPLGSRLADLDRAVAITLGFAITVGGFVTHVGMASAPYD